MQIRSRAALAAALLGPLALSACSSSDASSGDGEGGTNLAVVGFSVMETPNDAAFTAFEKTDAGKDVTFDGPAYGASGDMSRGVVDGQDADLVHFSLEPDMTRLVDAGIVAEDWKDGDTAGICTQLGRRHGRAEGQPQEHRQLGRPGQGRRLDRHPEPGLVRLGQVEPAGRLRLGDRRRRQRGRRRGLHEHVLRARLRAARLRPRRHDRVHPGPGRRPAVLRERGHPGPPERRGLRLRRPRHHAC